MQGAAPALPFTRALVRALSATVLLQACAGACGGLGRASSVLALIAGVAAGLSGLWRRISQPRDGGVLEVEGALASTMLACGVLFVLAERLVAAATRSELPYDALSYHLALPLSWLSSGHLDIVPLPFGDGAPAFAPANPSLLAATFMALSGKVQAAQLSQWPFLVLATTAVVEMARARGAAPAISWALAGLLLALPELYQQSTCAMGDVAVVGCALAVMAVWLFAPERPDVDVRAAASGGAPDAWLALGLLAGTKSVGLVVAVAVGAIALLRGPGLAWFRRGCPGLALRRAGLGLRACFACFAFFAAGGFWCARTALRTGNPLFPVGWTLAGRTLLAGFYTTADMRAWQYHVPLGELGELGAIVSDQGLGFLLFVVGWCAARPSRRWTMPLGLAAGAAFLWCVLPYQEPRFFLVVWAGGILAAARLSDHDDSRGRACLGLALAVAWLFPMVPARWVAVAVGLSGGGLVTAVRGRLFRCSSRRLASAALPSALVLAVGAPLVASGLWNANPVVLAATTDDADSEGRELAEAWRWMDAHGEEAPVFVAGTNLVGPWAGDRAQRDLHVVNLAGQLDFPLDRYPCPGDLGRTRLPAEPFPDRARPDRAAWARTLRASAPAWLVVVRLSPVVAEVQPHDGDGFPAERSWADEAPGRFALQFANASVRLYAVVAGTPGDEDSGPPTRMGGTVR